MLHINYSFSFPRDACTGNISMTNCLLTSSNEMACLSVVLRITDVKETDLSLTFDCIALNRAGIRIHTAKLRRKKPSKECF